MPPTGVLPERLSARATEQGCAAGGKPVCDASVISLMRTCRRFLMRQHDMRFAQGVDGRPNTRAAVVESRAAPAQCVDSVWRRTPLRRRAAQRTDERSSSTRAADGESRAAPARSAPTNTPTKARTADGRATVQSPYTQAPALQTGSRVSRRLLSPIQPVRSSSAGVHRTNYEDRAALTSNDAQVPAMFYKDQIPPCTTSAGWVCGSARRHCPQGSKTPTAPDAQRSPRGCSDCATSATLYLGTAPPSSTTDSTPHATWIQKHQRRHIVVNESTYQRDRHSAARSTRPATR
ncbi:hypothetical protein HYPSUDRAFT_201393 [Hypholoma sublateritium FD-334 SS-4]|uniref:Uncharacterized protein n=1 Tax=Hypholoma sublateritium (strain FD-334 SS-4) TaxID=945553 RepID=A0A0D2PUU7_HYPSF|nr:hypothetical protein HYPSUDRAFT_201393 [Hypholoma sublateritium FD-334 SS-4]